MGRKYALVTSQSLVVHLSDREISAEIIEACRLGDRDAFRALYETYKDRVYSISLYFFSWRRGLCVATTAFDLDEC